VELVMILQNILTSLSGERYYCYALSTDLRDRPIELRYRPIALRIRRIRR